MTRRFNTVLIGVGAVTTCALALGFFGPAASPAYGSTADQGRSTAVQCCSPHPGRFLVDGARIRSAPNFDAPVRGYGYRTHQATVWCVERGPASSSGGVNWLNLTNHTTGVSGWSHNDVVTWDESAPGAMYGC